MRAEGLRRWILAASLGLLGLLYAFDSSGVGLLGPDEPRYASIGRTMAESGDWVTTKLWGTPWFEKPPLTYWLIALGHSVGLHDETAARWPVAVISAAFLILFFLELEPIFGGWTSWTAAALLGTSVMWAAYSSVAVTDVPLGATFGGAMVLGWTGLKRDDDGRLRWAGVLLGLSILAKALVGPALVLPLVWEARARLRRLLVPALLALLVAAPWYGVMLCRFGRPFWDDLIVRQHFTRFVTTSLQHVQPWWFYVPMFAGALLPWTPFLAIVRWRDAATRFFVLWLAWGLIFFSVAVNKLPGYLVPLPPPAALLAALGWQRAAHARLVLACCVFLLALAPAVVAMLPDVLSSGFRHVSLGTIPWGWVALAVVPALGVPIFRHPLDIVLAVTLAAAGLFYVKLNAWPEVDRQMTARPLWREVAPQASATCVEELPRALRYGLNYYSREVLPDCRNEDRPFKIRRDGSSAPPLSEPAPGQRPR